MPNKSSPHHDVIRSNEPVWVQCTGYRCLAYRYERHNWRNFHSSELIVGPVELCHQPGLEKTDREI